MGNSETISNNQIFELLQAVATQNDEIKRDLSEIKNSNVKQAQSILVLSAKVTTLEEENRALKQELLAVNRKIRKNNIILFGVQENDAKNIKNEIQTIFRDTLNINLDDIDIDDVYRLGTKTGDKPRPVKVELISNEKKQKIFNSIGKFKGTGISVSNDLTPDDRQIHNALYQHLKIARGKNYLAKISKNRLIVNGQSYTLAELNKREELIDEETINIPEGDLQELISAQESHSAPPTPNASISTETSSTEKFNIKDNQIGKKQNLQPSTPKLTGTTGCRTRLKSNQLKKN